MGISCGNPPMYCAVTNIVPGDCHGTACLAMTYFVVQSSVGGGAHDAPKRLLLEEKVSKIFDF